MSRRHSISGRATRGPGGGSGLEALADEREFLRQSIADLEQELASGEVDETDFRLLQSRYESRLLEIETAIAGLAGADEPGPAPGSQVAVTQPDGAQPVSRTRRVRRRLGSGRIRLAIGVAAGACFIVAATLLAMSLAGVRLPGESISGSVSLSNAQQEQETLDRAAILGSEGQVAEAVQLYDEVLQTDPNQPDALTYGGWLVRLAGLSSKNRLVLARGDASIARAVKVAPRYPDAHALFAVVLYEDFGNARAASVQFRDALGAGASKSLVDSVAAIAAKAFATASESLPSRYAAAVVSPSAAG